VLDRAVVPDDEVADPPPVPVLELRPDDLVGEALDERHRLLVRHPLDADALPFAHVEGLRPAHRVGAGDGMDRVRMAGDLLGGQLDRALELLKSWKVFQTTVAEAKS